MKLLLISVPFLQPSLILFLDSLDVEVCFVEHRFGMLYLLSEPFLELDVLLVQMKTFHLLQPVGLSGGKLQLKSWSKFRSNNSRFEELAPLSSLPTKRGNASIVESQKLINLLINGVKKETFKEKTQSQSKRI